MVIYFKCIGGEMGQSYEKLVCVVTLYQIQVLIPVRNHHGVLLAQIELFLVDEVSAYNHLHLTEHGTSQY